VSGRVRRVSLVGNEGAGLSSGIEALADDRVTIPMTGNVDSLNVATATGIALHLLRPSRPPTRERA
jgi:tRNA G18 (ribose-2'-O)-methylase SpoU